MAIASIVLFGSDRIMEATWSERLRQRSRELRLTDADVARRVGLSQTRYSSYARGKRQPDLELFARICAALGTTPDAILGVTESRAAPEPTAITEIGSAIRCMDSGTAEFVADLVKLVERRVVARKP